MQYVSASNRRTLDTRPHPFAAVLAAAALFALLAPAVFSADEQGAGSGPLDGRRFVGETGEAGAEHGSPAEFVFEGGRFDPLACHPLGFSAAPYQATAESGAVHFKAETLSETEGRMRWTGKVEGDRIEGTVLWLKTGQAPIERWFSGTREAEGGKPTGPARDLPGPQSGSA